MLPATNLHFVRGFWKPLFDLRLLKGSCDGRVNSRQMPDNPQPESASEIMSSSTVCELSKTSWNLSNEHWNLKMRHQDFPSRFLGISSDQKNGGQPATLHCHCRSDCTLIITILQIWAGCIDFTFGQNIERVFTTKWLILTRSDAFSWGFAELAQELVPLEVIDRISVIKIII